MQPLKAYFGRHRFQRYFAKASILTGGLYFFNKDNQYGADFRGISRGLTNTLIAGPIVASCVQDYLTSLKGLEYPTDEYFAVRKECHQRSADKILYLALNCGGIYFKASQYMGTLENIVPKPYCTTLRVLQDKAPYISFEEIKITYEKDHNCKLEDVFDDFDPVPIGAASLAQVHKAKLKTGEKVAIKL